MHDLVRVMRGASLAALVAMAGGGTAAAAETWWFEEPAPILMPALQPVPGTGLGLRIAGTPADRPLAGRVAIALERTLYLAPFGVVVAAEGPKITLAGTVPTIFARDLATEVAAKVNGVTAVANLLFVSEYPATPGACDPVDAKFVRENRTAPPRAFFGDWF